MQEFLRLSGIYKSFEGVRALKGVDLVLNRGEIHGLVGENGSGKSTVIKIISGFLQPDSGRIFFEGRELSHLGSSQTTSRGVQVIYQDLSLFPNLTVGENIALSEMRARRRPLADWREVERIARAAMARIKVDIDLGKLVEELPIGTQQLVAICRALTSDVRLLILDEPTASLTKADITNLLAVTRDLQSRGIAILFVSHKLNEIFDVAENITIFRDGATVGTFPSKDLTNESLIELMTGKALSQTRYARAPGKDQTTLELRHLSKRYNFKDISFSLRQGDILGIIGLIGSGRTELACAIYGISLPDSGEILVNGKRAKIRSVQDAVGAGIAYVPENRLLEGLIQKQSVMDNLNAAIMGSLAGPAGYSAPARRIRQAEEWIDRLSIKVASPLVSVQTLSGGNQQRVVIAKCLSAKPAIMILDSPTVGIDILAKAAIHEMIRAFA
jgi:simple sugar transport system ATP-binding protein